MDFQSTIKRSEFPLVKDDTYGPGFLEEEEEIIAMPPSPTQIDKASFMSEFSL